MDTAKPAPSPTEGIPELLEEYEAALERKDMAALKRIWPSLGGAQEAAIRSEFQHANRIEVQIVSPQITVRDNTATVRFLRRYQLYTTDGQLPRSQSNTTMTLQRSGGNWTIAQIQYDLLR